jgi:beta-lactamase class A
MTEPAWEPYRLVSSTACMAFMAMVAIAATLLTTDAPLAAQTSEQAGRVTPPPAQAAERAILAAKFQRFLEQQAASFPGVMGVEVVDLTSGERFGVADTLVFPQGSAIKIPLLIELYHQVDAGRLNLDQRVEVSAADQVGGSGVLQYFAAGGSSVSIHDLAILMITLSDNSATNILIGRVGMDAVNRTMASLGYPDIKLQRLMIHEASSARNQENVATPAEAASLMARIARCDLPMRKERCEALRAMLEIPKEGSFPRPIPSGIKVAWKPGNITGVATAWGLVELPGRPYIVTVMTNYGRGEGDDAIETISKGAYDYFARLAGATGYGTRVPLELLKPAADTSAAHDPGGSP